MTGRGSAETPLVVGVVGPRDLVNRVVLGDVAGDGPGQAVSLLPIAYRQEDEALARVEQYQAETDALLFTGPLPYDLVRASGRLRVPAGHISLSGDAFYAALLRCVVDHAGDPGRISVDTVSEVHVRDAYADVDLPVDGVHVHSYCGPESASTLAAFHVELFQSGATTAALTGVQSVHRKLLAAGVPALRILPSAAATRDALNAAVLMGRGTRLEDAQIAIGIVEIPALLQNAETLPHQWQHELRLGVHRVLIHEGRQMGATVLPLDGGSFIVIATLGSLSKATRDLRTPPFVEQLQAELGVSAHIGVGLGRTAEEAESNARVAVSRDQGRDAAGFVVGLASTPARRAGVPPGGATGRETQPNRTSARQTYDRILASLGSAVDTDEPVVLDAGRLEELLNVQNRTARRLLRSVAEAGLAWPLPLDTPSGPGRPRQRYRLMIDRHQEPPDLQPADLSTTRTPPKLPTAQTRTAGEQ